MSVTSNGVPLEQIQSEDRATEAFHTAIDKIVGIRLRRLSARALKLSGKQRDDLIQSARKDYGSFRVSIEDVFNRLIDSVLLELTKDKPVEVASTRTRQHKVDHIPLTRSILQTDEDFIALSSRLEALINRLIEERAERVRVRFIKPSFNEVVSLIVESDAQRKESTRGPCSRGEDV